MENIKNGGSIEECDNCKKVFILRVYHLMGQTLCNKCWNKKNKGQENKTKK